MERPASGTSTSPNRWLTALLTAGLCLPTVVGLAVLLSPPDLISTILLAVFAAPFSLAFAALGWRWPTVGIGLSCLLVASTWAVHATPLVVLAAASGGAWAGAAAGLRRVGTTARTAPADPSR